MKAKYFILAVFLFLLAYYVHKNGQRILLSHWCKPKKMPCGCQKKKTLEDINKPQEDTGEVYKMNAATRLDCFIDKLSKKLDRKHNIAANSRKEKHWSPEEKRNIQYKCQGEAEHLNKQVMLLRKLKEDVFNDTYENVGYGVFVLKNVRTDKAPQKVYKMVIDQDEKDLTLLCNKKDLTNIGLVVPHERIVDLYWQDFKNDPYHEIT